MTWKLFGHECAFLVDVIFYTLKEPLLSLNKFPPKEIHLYFYAL